MTQGLGRTEPAGHHHTGLANVSQTFANELRAHRRPVDLLEDAGGLLRRRLTNTRQGGLGILVPGPQPFQVSGLITESMGAATTGMSTW